MVFASTSRYDEALSAQRRTVTLAGDEPAALVALGRFLIIARRFEAADSAITIWSRAGGELHRLALDLRVMLLREQGRLRASNRTIDTLDKLDPGHPMALVRANSLARLGNYASAERIYEDLTHGRERRPVPLPLAGAAARAFCWHHALLADAIAGSGLSPVAGDTVRLIAIADTLQAMCGRSYFGRDWRLYHHVRGLIATRAGRYDEAAGEFQQAQWSRWGWTRTSVEEANTYLQLGRPGDAVAVLRDAYAASLDGMARYVPRSELDFRMALALRAAGLPDSATLYAGYARRAWKNADPEVKRLLTVLP